MFSRSKSLCWCGCCPPPTLPPRLFFLFFCFFSTYAQVAKIISTIHDDVKDKPYVLEMSWVCEATGFKHRMISEDVVLAARQEAETAIKAEEEESDDDDDDDDDDE